MSYIVTGHDVVDGGVSNEPAINYGRVCVSHTSTVVMFTIHVPSSSSSEVPSGESV